LLKNIIDLYLEKRKATIWPVDDGMIVGLEKKGLFQISVKQIAEPKFIKRQIKTKINDTKT
jgi:hypothetical protein